MKKIIPYIILVLVVGAAVGLVVAKAAPNAAGNCRPGPHQNECCIAHPTHQGCEVVPSTTTTVKEITQTTIPTTVPTTTTSTTVASTTTTSTTVATHAFETLPATR